MEKNTIKLSVCSQNLTIVTDETEEYVKGLAEEINDKVDIMVKQYRYTPVMSAVMLCTMQYCDGLHKLQGECKELTEKCKALEAEVEALKKKSSPKQLVHKSSSTEMASRAVHQGIQESFFDNEKASEEKSDRSKSEASAQGPQHERFSARTRNNKNNKNR